MNLHDLFGTRDQRQDSACGWKYWSVELRFASRLNSRQRRALRACYGFDGYTIGRDSEQSPWAYVIGCDGTQGMWSEKWPGQRAEQALMDALIRVGVKAWVRAAPYIGIWVDAEDEARDWCDRVRARGIGRHRRLPEEWFVFDPLARTVRLGVSSPPFSHWEWSR